jgi:hypothetical protein
MNQAQAATRAAVAIAAIGIAITGCSGSTHTASSTAATANAGGTPVTATSPTTGPATGPTTVPATGPTTGPTTPPSSPAAVPTLGQLTGDFAHGQGFGQVKPAKIFNGGDPTGLVTHVTWSSWGGPRAQATGTSEYVGPNQSVATGRPATATVVAFDLGTCDGKLMYQAVEWYFPQHGQSFSPHHYENICTGSYVPAQ